MSVIAHKNHGQVLICASPALELLPSEPLSMQQSEEMLTLRFHRDSSMHGFVYSDEYSFEF